MPESIHIDMSQALGSLQAIQARASNLAPAMAPISMVLGRSVRKNFEVGGRYSEPGSIMGGSNRWVPRKYPGFTHKILLRSGILQRSIAEASNQDAAWAHTNRVQAAILNFGGTTKPHEIKARNAKALRFPGAGGKDVFRRSVHHPGSKFLARPFLVIQPEDMELSKTILVHHVLGRGGSV